VSRHWNRPISRIVSLLLLSLRLQASHASLLTLLVGVGAAAIGVQPGYAAFLVTGILFQLASVLDGVDGEMARATLSESDAGARLDAMVDQITYVACFVGVTIGWVREGRAADAIVWTTAVVVALALTLMRAGRFVSRYAPDASFVFIDRSVRRAARDSTRAGLRVVPGLFTLMRRDLFALVFLAVSLTGLRVLVPALVAVGVIVANLTFSIYRRELAEAAVGERRESGRGSDVRFA
jgi:CDP-L-myo-inositol myo-inositolphosphotransferase